MASGRKQRTRTQPQRYQSDQEEERDRQMKQKARETKQQQSQSRESPVQMEEDESHDWKEGERMGEAKQPGPPTQQRWGGVRPWGQERRQPGHAPQAQQAWGSSQPHQKWQQPATNRQSRDAEGWTTVRGTATTSTRTSSYPPRKRTQYDSHPSSMPRPPVGGNTEQQHIYTHPYSKVCWYGSSCRRGNCPYWHPTMDLVPDSKPCWYGSNCRRDNCPYWHPIKGMGQSSKACWYGSGCKKGHCPFWHPEKMTNTGSPQARAMAQ